MVKSSVNGAREERMTIMDIAACVKWTLNVTMLAKPNCHNMQRGKNILKSLSTCKVLSKANCYPVIVKPQVQVKEDLALVKEALVLVKEDLALVSQNMVKPHKNKASVLLNPALANLSGFVYYDDASLKAEIYWLAKVACSNYILCSCDCVGDMLRAMFPDSKIAAHFL